MPDQTSPAKVIQGNRIRLLARANDQAAEMFLLIDKNRDHLNKWMPWVEKTRKVEDSLAYLETAQSWWDKRTCELGYWIDEAHQGRGYVNEAVLLGEEIAFDLGFHRIVVTCDRQNQRSQQIPKRLHYRLEATQIDECIDHHGKQRDTLQFVKLLNPPIEGQITENLPTGYSIQTLEAEPFWESVEKKMELVFSNDLIFRVREIYSNLEREKLEALNQNFKHPFLFHAVLKHENEVVGWTWGYQDSRESYYMVNSGVLSEHRGRGLYSRLLQFTIEMLVEKGFQRIWSRHNNTNNEVIIPKLKQGFQITGTELSDVFGSLIHLTYFTNETRKKVLNFRSGHLRPDTEVKRALDL